jgi:hypothetical protein
MKAQFLKIAKVKDEKAFYKKYPTEAAFFKAHPEARSIKKAEIGMSIPGSVPGNNPKYVNYQDVYNDVYQSLTGIDVEEEQKMQRQAQLQAQALKGSGGGEGGGGGAGGMQSMLPLLKGLLKSKGGEEGGGEGFGEDIVPTGMDIMGGGDLSMAARYGRNIPKAQGGEIMLSDEEVQNEGGQYDGYSDPGGPIDLPGTRFGRFADKAENIIGKGLPIVGPIMSGFNAISQKKQEAKAARQAKEVSGLGLIASTTQPEKIENKYTTPWDVPVGRNQLSKSYGVGTNILTRNGGEVRRAQDGSRIGGNPTEIQNTYAPGYLYDDLGYEPLNDSNQVKQYEGGGAFSQFMNEEGGAGMASGLSNSLFDNSGESQIGAGMGQGIGMLIPGVGGELGKLGGGILGGIYGKLFGNNSAERDAEATQRNIEGMAMNNMGSKVRSPYTAFTKNGGNVNPQLINRFGNLTAQDFAEFAHQDEFRAGGHLRQYTNPSEEAMQTYKDGGEVRRSALNGEVQTTWGGGVRTLSHNPYMPSTGETIEFVGNSHDKYDPRSKQTGIGVKYGQGNQDSYTDYAEYGTEQADANVEVEKEPAAELIDPKTGEKNLTVYGNLKIPNQYLDILGDKNAKGKKFKHYVSDLSKQEEKENEKIATSTNLLDNLDVKNSFDRLKLSSLEASINGANMKLKTLADRKIKAADIQNAINETADEYGILADDLARGKFKINKEATDEYARYGKQMFANGGIIEPLEKLKKMLKDKGFDYTQSSGVRPGAKTKQGRKSRHSSGEAMDLVFPKLGKGSYNAMLNDPEIARFMLDNNLTAIDEYDEDNLKQTGGTGGHLHIGLDKGTSLSDKFRKEARLLYDLKTTTPATTTPASSTNATAPVTTAPVTTAPVTTTKPIPLKEYTSEEELKADGFKQNANGEWYKSVEGTKKTTEKSSASAMDNIPKQQSVDETTGLYGGVTAEEFEEFKKKNQWYPKFKDNTFDQNNPEHVDDLAKAFNAKSEAMGSKARILPDRDGNGKTTKVGKQVVSANLNSTKKVQPAVGKRLEAVVEELPNTKTVPHKRSGLIDFANQALDYIRPSDQEPFDYGQAMAEISALTDQVEPVQAQLYKPEIGVPYDISYQDVLDENQADYNSLVKKTGYNPAVQSNFAANKYLANQKVLAEQFRANQAMKAGVYGENRNTLNQAKLTNLGILDKQYERQSEAISNTKAGRLAALTSLQDKVAKHALENKTLGVYENLYKYRYDSKGRAINMNGIFQPNIGTVGSTAGTQKQVPIYGPDGKTITSYQLVEMTPQEIALQESNNSGAIPSLATLPININLQSKTKNKSRNGSIVKAIKNL